MSALTIPLMSIYNFDDTVLDGLHVPTTADLPDGIEYIDPIPELSDNDLHMQLLFELGELSPVYTDPEVLKKMIEIWGRVNRQNWISLWQTTLYKYNPIWNKDGTYTETREFTLSGQRQDSVTYDEDRSRSESGTETSAGETTTTESGTGNEQTTHSVTGYNTNTLSPAHSDSTSRSSSSTGKEVYSGQNGLSRSATENTDADTSSSGTEARTESETFRHVEQGNIGVTTTQQMIREQREVVSFNIYNTIISAFKKQFMIAVWDI